MEQISLSKTDLEKIQRVLEKFNVKKFELIKDSTSGIGYVLDITFWTHINREYCQVIIPLVNAEKW
jgi:hypothetical protein